ncbi:hypothetical protein HY468_05360 [Candidatus Roizmanbacteria bacterium]|nr:hypothetical protein [Candidatus Roizmanbacteria bacterium]
MRIKTNERVKVLSIYDPDQGKTLPYRLSWSGNVHNISKVSYYHQERHGRITFHIYHVTDGTLDFRLTVDSETLAWRLREVTDGN